MLSAKYSRIEEQFRALSDEVRLVILHPAAYSEHRLFGQYLLNEAVPIYVHLPIVPTDLLSMAQEIGDTIQEQTGLQVGPIAPDNPGLALAEAMNAIPASVLYLEGYDSNFMPEVQDLIMAVVKYLAEGHRVVISGRQMAARLLQLGSRKVALVPIDPQRMLVDYVHPEPGKTFLEVRAFGQGQVHVNGQAVVHWEGFLPRALFFFLVDRAMTTRDEIFQIFWPKLLSKEATNVFHVTKRKISEILNISPTVYESGFYRLTPQIDLYYDVVNFQEAVQNAMIADDETAEELYRIAIDLYREEFLSSIQAEWVVRRREEMRSTYTDALTGLARIYERRENYRQALGLFLRAAAVARTREDLSRAIMRLYDQLEQPELALETYARLEELLKKSVGVAPDPQTIEVMEQIKKKLKR